MMVMMGAAHSLAFKKVELLNVLTSLKIIVSNPTLCVFYLLVNINRTSAFNLCSFSSMCARTLFPVLLFIKHELKE